MCRHNPFKICIKKIDLAVAFVLLELAKKVGSESFLLSWLCSVAGGDRSLSSIAFLLVRDWGGVGSRRRALGLSQSRRWWCRNIRCWQWNFGNLIEFPCCCLTLIILPGILPTATAYLKLEGLIASICIFYKAMFNANPLGLFMWSSDLIGCFICFQAVSAVFPL